MRVEVGNKKLFKESIFEILGHTLEENNINGITIDSRMVQEGDVFIALKGKNTNGHKYINKCLKNGATLIINEQINSHSNIVKVDSSKLAMKSIASFYRSNNQCKIIGITGSNGKTTTKEILYHVLKSNYNVSCTKKNYNSTIGMPMSFFSISNSDEYFIAEMGINNPKEMQYLCEVAKPDIGIVTNISEAHLKNFNNINDICNEKMSLIKSITKNGIAFINADDKKIIESIDSASTYPYKVIKYGWESSNNYVYDCEDITSKKFKINQEIIEHPYLSENLIKNITAAFSIAIELGISTNKFKKLIKSFRIPHGRGRIINNKSFIIIDDSYNSNFTSTTSGLRYLSTFSNQNSRKIAVLGDMLELGKNEKKMHKGLLPHIIKNNIKNVFLYGSLMEMLYEKAKKNNDLEIKYFKKQSDLISALKIYVRKNDIIYIKGSRGMCMEKIIKGIN